MASCDLKLTAMMNVFPPVFRNVLWSDEGIDTVTTGHVYMELSLPEGWRNLSLLDLARNSLAGAIPTQLSYNTALSEFFAEKFSIYLSLWKVVYRKSTS